MYILEGNIGVGKTTFLTLLKKHCPQIDIMTEPVEDWNKQNYGQSLLENFYKNTSRWAYTLETLTMICRTRDHIKEQKNANPLRVFERSIYSGHYCFARNCYENGHLTEVEWKIYNEWADFLIHSSCAPPKGFIYLRADAKTCFSRVQKRDRSSEKSLTIDYIRDINFWHDEFLVKKNNVTPLLKKIPVLVLDCNEDFVENTKNMEKHAKKVYSFLQKTCILPPKKTPPESIYSQNPSTSHQEINKIV